MAARQKTKVSSTVVKGERQRVRKGIPRMRQRSVKRSEWNRKGYTGGIWEDRSFEGGVCGQTLCHRMSEAEMAELG